MVYCSLLFARLKKKKKDEFTSFIRYRRAKPPRTKYIQIQQAVHTVMCI